MGDLKYRAHFTTTIPKEYIKTMDKLSAETRIAKSKLVEEAFKDLFEKHGIEIENPDA